MPKPKRPSIQIIAVCNQKGGVGKTTTTMGLAYEYAVQGKCVLICDADPQQSAADWAACAEEEKPFPARIVNVSSAAETEAGLANAISEQLALAEYDVVIIDCPPNVDDRNTQSALLLADLAVVPIIPAPGDTSSATRFFALIEETRVDNPELAVLIVPTKFKPGTSISTAYLETFVDFPFPTTRAQLELREAHAKAWAEGNSVREQRDPKAIAALKLLHREVTRALRARESR